MVELTREVRMEFTLVVSSLKQGQVESSPERVLVVGLEGERRRRVFGYWCVVVGMMMVVAGRPERRKRKGGEETEKVRRSVFGLSYGEVMLRVGRGRRMESGCRGKR